MGAARQCSRVWLPNAVYRCCSSAARLRDGRAAGDRGGVHALLRRTTEAGAFWGTALGYGAGVLWYAVWYSSPGSILRTPDDCPLVAGTADFADDPSETKAAVMERARAVERLMDRPRSGSAIEFLCAGPARYDISAPDGINLATDVYLPAGTDEPLAGVPRTSRTHAVFPGRPFSCRRRAISHGAVCRGAAGRPRAF